MPRTGRCQTDPSSSNYGASLRLFLLRWLMLKPDALPNPSGNSSVSRRCMRDGVRLAEFRETLACFRHRDIVITATQTATDAGMSFTPSSPSRSLCVWSSPQGWVAGAPSLTSVESFPLRPRLVSRKPQSMQARKQDTPRISKPSRPGLHLDNGSFMLAIPRSRSTVPPLFPSGTCVMSTNPFSLMTSLGV